MEHKGSRAYSRKDARKSARSRTSPCSFCACALEPHHWKNVALLVGEVMVFLTPSTSAWRCASSASRLVKYKSPHNSPYPSSSSTWAETIRQFTSKEKEEEAHHYPGPKQQKPKRIILCRHGESLGNVDDSVYTHTADWRIPLSEKGRNQARDAGKRLAKLTQNEKCFIYHSPYARTTETMKEMMSQLKQRPRQCIGTRSEPRMVEQQFGNFQNYEEVQESRDERVKFGRFFYRFPSGEAGLDVYNRVTIFISTLFRDTHNMRKEGVAMEKLNVVVVTHGLTLRLFLMRWLQISVDEFEEMYNPDNAFLAVMERQTSECGTKQWYELTEESAKHLRIKQRTVNPLIIEFDEEDID